MTKNKNNTFTMRRSGRILLSALCIFFSMTTAKAVPIAIPVVVAAESIYLALTSVTVGGVVYFAHVDYVPNVVSSSFSDAVVPALTNDAEASRTQKTFQGAAQLKAIAAQYTTLKNMVEDEWIQRIPAQKVAEFISAVGALEHAQIQELRINPQTLAMASAWLMPASADLSPAFVYANGDDIDFDNTLAQEFVDSTPSASRSNCDPRDALKHFQKNGYQVNRIGKVQNKLTISAPGQLPIERPATSELWRLFKGDGHECTLTIDKLKKSDGGIPSWQFRIQNGIYPAGPGMPSRSPHPNFFTRLMEFMMGGDPSKNPQFQEFDAKNCNDMKKTDGNGDDVCSALMRIFFGM